MGWNHQLDFDSIIYHQQRFITLRHRAHLGHITIFQRRKIGQFFRVKTSFPPNNGPRGSHEFRKRPGKLRFVANISMGKPSCLEKWWNQIIKSKDEVCVEQHFLTTIFKQKPTSQNKKIQWKVSMKCKDSSFSRWWFQIFFDFTPIWGRFPFWLIFFNWVVQPPTSFGSWRNFHPHFFFGTSTEVASRHLHSQRVHYQRTSPLEFGNPKTEVFTIKHIHSTRLNFRVDEFSGCFFCLFFTEPNDGNGGLNLFFFCFLFFSSDFPRFFMAKVWGWLVWNPTDFLIWRRLWFRSISETI